MNSCLIDSDSAFDNALRRVEHENCASRSDLMILGDVVFLATEDRCLSSWNNVINSKRVCANKRRVGSVIAQEQVFVPVVISHGESNSVPNGSYTSVEGVSIGYMILDLLIVLTKEVDEVG